MTIVHREFGPKHSIDKLRNKARTTKELGKRVARLLAHGPVITEAMLDPDLSHTFPLVNEVKGIPTERVASDTSILIAPKTEDRLYHIPSRGAGDHSHDSRWSKRNS